MPLRQLTHIPITDPDILAAMRRYIAAAAATLFGLYALAWVLHLTNPFGFWTIAAAMVPMFIATIALIIARRRIVTVPRLSEAVFPYPLGLTAAVITGLIPCVPMTIAFAFPSLPMSWVNGFIAVPLFFAGLQTVISTLTLREARPPCCPRCCYPVTTLSFPLMCPECAHPMPTPEAATTTPRVYRRGPIASGVAAMLLGVAVFATVIARPSAVYTTMPRAMLLRSAAINPDAFAALNPAVFTQAERESLASRVMDARLRAAYPIDLLPQLDWLADEIAAGRLAAAFAERYALDAFELFILHDPPAARTEPTRITIGGSPPEYSANALRVRYFFAGFEIDNAPPIGRDTRDRWTESLDTTIAQRDREDARRQGTVLDPMSFPMHTQIIDRPTHIRARIIVFVTPQAPSPLPTITWHDDGSYTIIPTPLTTRELTAETTLKPNP